MLDVDDTLFHKAGRNVEGAGVFAGRGALHRPPGGLRARTEPGRGHLRVTPPWGGPPIALPVNARLHRKNDTTSTVEHAAAMVRELACWLPDREFHLCGDGAYASLCGAGLPRTHVTSRIRRDAALYQPAPPRTGKRGRPRTKGERLPTPTGIATAARATDWQQVDAELRGRTVPRLVLVRDVLWYTVNKRDLLRLVIVRDPDGIEPDDFFITTDRTATGAQVASRYAGRWSIEVCFLSRGFEPVA